ncbi:hypothetical protein [Pseudomonas sp. UBA6562]|uniref:hypothetical protein n=1 Tax=Pseudomonas sp. UBA6562 TaxID=1947332 RepID=UPI0025FEC844|nr:hypothetical protein [Pseudomonas sp. UBA6562]
MSEFIEISGTLNLSRLPFAPWGYPPISIKVTNAAKVRLASSFAQTSGTQVPFRIQLAREAFTPDSLLTLTATCDTAISSDFEVARCERTLTVAEATREPLQLALQTLPDIDPVWQEHPTQAHFVEISGRVSVQPELRHADALLLVALYVVQEDGQSNQRTSNVAEYAVSASGDDVPFALFVDPAVIPDGRPVVLDMTSCDQTGNEIYVGGQLPLDLDNLPDLSALVLRSADN